MTGIIFDESLFKKVAQDVESEYNAGGLSEGMYYDYAMDCTRLYIQRYFEKLLLDYIAESMKGFDASQAIVRLSEVQRLHMIYEEHKDVLNEDNMTQTDVYHLVKAIGRLLGKDAGK